jgi:hypothetical protein
MKRPTEPCWEHRLARVLVRDLMPSHFPHDSPSTFPVA